MKNIKRNENSKIKQENQCPIAKWQGYTPFGESDVGNTLTRYGFTGRETDSATNLMYYRARWYDAQQGRLITQDPIGFAGGNTNLYSYVSNNPVSKTDPSGLYEIDVHFYLTNYLARKTGCFSDDYSRRIAEGNQGTDEEDSTLPAYGREFQNSYYHALFDGAQEGVGSPLLLQNVNNSNPKYFGQYLHYLQDTFSHAGFTNSYYGHLFGTHYFDKTASDIPKTIRMAKSTYAALSGYAQLKCSCKANPWNQVMEDQIRRFAAIKTHHPFLADIEGDVGGGYKNSSLASPLQLLFKADALDIPYR